MSFNNVQVDLHLHSDYSDGRMDPDSLVRLCDREGLKVISLTDHDTTSGLHEAKKTCSDLNIGFIPGIELGTVLKVKTFIYWDITWMCPILNFKVF